MSGIISCLLDNIEVRILKISPQKLTACVSEEIENMDSIKVMFYIFNENKYEEVKISSHVLIEKTKFEFYKYYLEQKEEWLSNLNYLEWDNTTYMRYSRWFDEKMGSSTIFLYNSWLIWNYDKNIF
ncbi:hypothetical protein [Clostridium saccharoperbutylacetonicum]|uniref:hypothetical protein n=1 Tax=Clostridium saccharoperbutylacetonicum TaxID=36745 RepID=UPI0039ED5AFC